MEDFPTSYNSHCQASVVKKIGQDMRGIVNYSFNKQGFRSDVDYDTAEKKAIAYFGNLYTSAIGIDWANGFPNRTSKELQCVSYNFSQGCVGVDNNEIARTVNRVVQMKNFEPTAYVIQFCELERRFNPDTGVLTLNTDRTENVKNFIDVFMQLESMMQDKKWLFFGIDHTMIHNLPKTITEHKNCLCWNPVIIDKILQGIAGEKWHAMIAYGLIRRMKNVS